MAQTKRTSERSHTSNCSTNPISTQSSESRIATTSNSLSDRSERAVAALLTRFKTLVTLAAEPVQDGDAATKEVAAAHALQMEVESSLLVRAAEDLLQLTRELKELWLFGPLRGIKEGEGEGQMDEDSKRVGELVEGILGRVADARV
ncbi:hypothetical protein JHW43_002241 [Diplocarpon mali]|nr:hypothetical protein JHW43_002241 [Diplocarpon mali]